MVGKHRQMGMTKLANGTKCLVYLNPRERLRGYSEILHQLGGWVVW